MELFYEWLIGNYIEIIASLLGIFGVWLTTKQKVWCWPIGLLNVILSLYVFLVSKLYADVVLQIFYIILTLYGWYNWLYGGENKTVLKVSRIKRSMMLFLILISFFCIFITGYIFSNYTDAALPYWDATVAVWGVIGTFVQAKKYIENWIIWIINDLLCTGIYFYKHLFAFTALYFVFVLLAVYGYIQWKKDLKKIAVA
ncbi:MAG TPA: nicotinamide riboside transporter PnuC [Bacteroidales bacterium]|nr:nicotinamide riboside transporter PnuC [Bacteroidales bacterium]HPS18485.1 nicotinamide riboside transporter PnuC [Bacteroidales bacterium]